MECLLFDPATKALYAGGEELVERWSADASATIWVRITGELDKETQKTLQEKFGIH